MKRYKHQYLPHSSSLLIIIQTVFKSCPLKHVRITNLTGTDVETLKMILANKLVVLKCSNYLYALPRVDANYHLVVI